MLSSGRGERADEEGKIYSDHFSGRVDMDTGDVHDLKYKKEKMSILMRYEYVGMEDAKCQKVLVEGLSKKITQAQVDRIPEICKELGLRVQGTVAESNMITQKQAECLDYSLKPTKVTPRLQLEEVSISDMGEGNYLLYDPIHKCWEVRGKIHASCIEHFAHNRVFKLPGEIKCESVPIVEVSV